MQNKYPFFILLFLFCIGNVETSAQVNKHTASLLLEDSAVREGHAGVSIYNITDGKPLYNYNEERFFMPASNVKLFSLYAGLHYLGDSILSATLFQNDSVVYVMPNGDPTFLNNEFSYQPLAEMLKNTSKKIQIVTGAWQDLPQGKGWMWDDFVDEYSAERALMPVKGNLVSFTNTNNSWSADPSYFSDRMFERSDVSFSEPVHRQLNQNLYDIKPGAGAGKTYSMPFLTENGNANLKILEAEWNKKIYAVENLPAGVKFETQKVYSYPTDTLYRLMMHRSDNFFAEQVLMMVSNAVLGFMNNEKIIKKILDEPLADLPKRPQWVDGSGLSRYNLFTPKDISALLQIMNKEFDFERLKYILPTGGEGTIKNYYQSEAGKIFAKTGTLSDNSAFSGYLITRKDKLLVFSVMINNYQKGGRAVRQAIEKFIKKVRLEN